VYEHPLLKYNRVFQKKWINTGGNHENKETIHTFKRPIYSNSLIRKLSLEIAEMPYPVGNRDSPGFFPLPSRSAIQEYIGLY
jgi:hypothetical protein